MFSSPLVSGESVGYRVLLRVVGASNDEALLSTSPTHSHQHFHLHRPTKGMAAIMTERQKRRGEIHDGHGKGKKEEGRDNHTFSDPR